MQCTAWLQASEACKQPLARLPAKRSFASKLTASHCKSYTTSNSIATIASNNLATTASTRNPPKGGFRAIATCLLLA